MKWTCRDCGHENELVNVCDNCGHMLTRNETLMLSLRQSRLGVLFNAHPGTERRWVSTLCWIFYCAAAGAIGFSLIPGAAGLSYLRTDATPYLLRADCTTVDNCEGDGGISGVSVLRVTSSGLLRRVAPPELQDAVYISLYGSRQGPEHIRFPSDGRSRIGQRDSLAWLRRVPTEDQSEPSRPTTGEFQRQTDSRRTLTAFSINASNNWIYSTPAFTIPSDGGLAPIIESPGPVSQLLSGPWQLIVVLGAIVLGLFAGGVRAASAATSGAVSLVLMIFLADSARGFIARVVGRVGTNPDYSVLLATLLALLAAALAIGGPVLVTIWLTKRTPRILTGNGAPAVTATGVVPRVVSAIAVPLLVVLSLAVIDQVVGAVLLGFEL